MTAEFFTHSWAVTKSTVEWAPPAGKQGGGIGITTQERKVALVREKGAIGGGRHPVDSMHSASPVSQMLAIHLPVADTGTSASAEGSPRRSRISFITGSPSRFTATSTTPNPTVSCG